MYSYAGLPTSSSVGFIVELLNDKKKSILHCYVYYLDRGADWQIDVRVGDQ